MYQTKTDFIIDFVIHFRFNVPNNFADSSDKHSFGGLASLSGSTPSWLSVPNTFQSINGKQALLKTSSNDFGHQILLGKAIEFTAPNTFVFNDENPATFGDAETVPKVRKSERLKSILLHQHVPPASASYATATSNTTESKETLHAHEQHRHIPLSTTAQEISSRNGCAASTSLNRPIIDLPKVSIDVECDGQISPGAGNVKNSNDKNRSSDRVVTPRRSRHTNSLKKSSNGKKSSASIMTTGETNQEPSMSSRKNKSPKQSEVIETLPSSIVTRSKMTKVQSEPISKEPDRRNGSNADGSGSVCGKGSYEMVLIDECDKKRFICLRENASTLSKSSANPQITESKFDFPNFQITLEPSELMELYTQDMNSVSAMMTNMNQ